jgi:hypothetical protein
MTNNHPHRDDALPDDLRAIDAQLAQLGEHARTGAPAGLTDRVYAASRSSLPVSTIQPTLRLTGEAARPATLQPRFRLGWAVRLAASVALLAGGIALVIALSPSSTSQPAVALQVPSPASTSPAATATETTSADTVVSATMASLAWLDNESFDNSIDEAFAEAERLSTSLDNPGDVRELLGQGAM